MWCVSCSSDTFAGIWNAHPDLTEMQAYSETPDVAQLDCWGAARGCTCLPLEICPEALLQLYKGLTFFPLLFHAAFRRNNLLYLHSQSSLGWVLSRGLTCALTSPKSGEVSVLSSPIQKRITER